MYKIIKKKELNPAVILIEIDAPLIAAKARAGQFVLIRTDGFGERIPLTVADYDRINGTVTVIFQVVGRTTALLSGLCEGDFIIDVTGPLGKPTDFYGSKKICIIGGGVGNAIAYPTAKALRESNTAADIIMGFRSKELIFFEDEMKAVSGNFTLATDDGSAGEKGFVTDCLKKNIGKGAEYDLVIAIGPIPMMKAVSSLTAEYGIKTTVSLNPIMIDGTGMCGGCRVKVDGKMKFACVDGPDFDGHTVDFDSLARRNTAYAEEEKHDRENCRLISVNP